ncbi:cAMP-regulated phosphoprotein 19-related protein [Actinidia rufa]|uniref:cAMP-regulated phosphoprotein 19-related protein n=1 Tax=Actinidia rufa TaxID=165716 RepID=A0A7J0EE92_9ERIC|nr:cAMP-regulated phosphoprotein 19-related protein [Actinidia rufa]
MSGMEDGKEHERVVEVGKEDTEKAMPSPQQEHFLRTCKYCFPQEAAIKSKYGGIMPKKPPLISKDHERAYFDSADWALGKQGVEKPKGPLEKLRPKLQCIYCYYHYLDYLVDIQLVIVVK